MKCILHTVLALGLCMGPAGAQSELPTHWEFFASDVAGFQASRVYQEAHQGESAALVSSKGARQTEHALLYQRISARDYQGKKLELSGFVRARSVKGWAGLWVRIDDSDGRVLQFDNMTNRPIRGDSPWTRYTISIEVPSEAAEIDFGALLSGSGEITIDDFTLRATGRLVPGKELKKKIRELPRVPANLDFEG